MTKEVKLYYSYFSSIRKLDPHVIHTAEVAVLGQNLYSRLLNLDDDGQIIGDLADQIQWNGRSCVLRIRRGITTIDGHEINAHDAAISLRRILRLDKNTHGSLKMFLNENGIREEGDTVVLTPTNPDLKDFLIQSLANIDFSVVPAMAFDLSQPDWPVVDWRNTSGLYYVDQDAEDGSLLLKINPSHHYFNEKQIQAIRLRPGRPDGAIPAFINGEVDIIPTTSMARGSDFRNIDSKDANRFESEPIYITCIRVATRGLKRLSATQRIKAGLAIKAGLNRALKPGDGVPVSEFFPASSEGSLNFDQRAQLNGAIEAAKSAKIDQPVTFGVYPAKFQYFKDLLKDVPDIEVVPTKGVPPWLEPEERQPDMYITVTDTCFYESFSLIYYNIALDAFMDHKSGSAWLDHYMGQAQEDRIRLVKEMHLAFLLEARMIPVSMSSYISVARKPLRPQFPKHYAGTPLWRLTRE